ncbi:MAG: hypothetical protein HY319_06655 [Armatimonadetes bacterium]|nr:hypothetical protein [Armatimonadota bacterium]
MSGDSRRPCRSSRGDARSWSLGLLTLLVGAVLATGIGLQPASAQCPPPPWQGSSPFPEVPPEPPDIPEGDTPLKDRIAKELRDSYGVDVDWLDDIDVEFVGYGWGMGVIAYMQSGYGTGPISYNPATDNVVFPSSEKIPDPSKPMSTPMKLKLAHELMHAYTDQVAEEGGSGSEALKKEREKAGGKKVVSRDKGVGTSQQQYEAAVEEHGLDPEAVADEAWGLFAEQTLSEKELVKSKKDQKTAQNMWDDFRSRGQVDAYDSADEGNSFRYTLERESVDFILNDLYKIPNDVSTWSDANPAWKK